MIKFFYLCSKAPKGKDKKGGAHSVRQEKPKKSKKLPDFVPSDSESDSDNTILWPPKPARITDVDIDIFEEEEEYQRNKFKGNQQGTPVRKNLKLTKKVSDEPREQFVRQRTQPAVISSKKQGSLTAYFSPRRNDTPSGAECTSANSTEASHATVVTSDVEAESISAYKRVLRKRSAEIVPFDPKSEAFLAMPPEKKLKKLDDQLDELKRELITTPREMINKSEQFFKNCDRENVTENQRLEKARMCAETSIKATLDIIAREAAEETDLAAAVSASDKNLEECKRALEACEQHLEELKQSAQDQQIQHNTQVAQLKQISNALKTRQECAESYQKEIDNAQEKLNKVRVAYLS